MMCLVCSSTSIGLAGIFTGIGMMALSALEIVLEREMMNRLKEVYCFISPKMRYRHV